MNCADLIASSSGLVHSSNCSGKPSLAAQSDVDILHVHDFIFEQCWQQTKICLSLGLGFKILLRSLFLSFALPLPFLPLPLAAYAALACIGTWPPKGPRSTGLASRIQVLRACSAWQRVLFHFFKRVVHDRCSPHQLANSVTTGHFVSCDLDFPVNERRQLKKPFPDRCVRCLSFTGTNDDLSFHCCQSC